jgi:hypothetical protein
VAAKKFERTPAADWSPQRTAALVRNTVNAYATATPGQRNLGAQFYPHWNEDAGYIASQSGQSEAHASALLARLSPTTEAEVNRMMGYQTLHLDDKQTRAITESATFAREAAKHPKNSPEQLALKEHSKNLRKQAGLPGTPLNLQTSSNISAALEHRDGVHANPLETLGRVKINDFGHTIDDPKYPRQTVDTHYHDAMHGRTDIPYELDRGLGAEGRYEAHQNVAGRSYDRAAHKGLIDPGKTPPNAFMGGIWYRHQQTKADTNPNAAKSRRASESRLGTFVNASRSGEWDPAKHGQRPVYSHITT